MVELAIALGIGILLVCAAYVIAGPVWKERHSLWYRIGDRRERTSGAVGEIVLITGGALLVAGIDLASPDISLTQMFERRPIELGGLFLFILPWIWIHGMLTAKGARPGEKRRLVFTYIVYGVYSTIFFFGGMVMLALMVEQFLAHAAAAETRGGDILAQLDTPPRTESAVQAALGASYLDAQRLLSTVEESMSPVFVFATGIFAINLAIRYTPLRGVFMKNAMLMTHISTLVAILAILVVGGITYVGFYSRFIDLYLAKLDVMRSAVISQAPAEIEHFSAVYIDILSQKSLLGFVTRMSNEWAGVAFVLGVAQWTIQQFARKEAEASPADRIGVDGASAAGGAA